MLHVAPAPPYRMTAAPLVEALAQVNFPIMPRLQTLEGIAPLQEYLSELLPYMNQQVVQQVEFAIGPAGPAGGSSQASTLSVFTSDDGWALQVSVGSATLSVDGASYRGVNDFRERLVTIWTGLQTVVGVRRCDRLALRYVDIVDASAETWADWFRPEIVGLTSPALSGGVLGSSLTETRLQAEPGGPLANLQGHVEGIIRHGVVPPGSIMQGIPPRPILQHSFIFDMDLFVAATQPLQADVLGAQFVELHSQMERLFHWAITDAGKARFGYELL